MFEEQKHSKDKTKLFHNTPLGDGGSVYFIGIGGIGMSALARYFHSKNSKVSGYDKTETVLTKQLQQEGIDVHYEDNLDLIDKQASVVVYTPAIPAEHKGLNYYRDNGYEVVKRSDVLQWITEASFNVCVAGTHGKTTVTSMVAHILRDTGYGCNAFLGGIAANYHTNFWSSENNTVVVEADEYDRSFLKLSPDVAIITAMDADHLDIYGTGEEVENAFIQFAGKVKSNGLLIKKYGLHRTEAFTNNNQLSYSFNDTAADVHVTTVKVVDGSYQFTVQGKGWLLNDVVLHMGGLHNIENCIAAITVAKHLQIEDDKIRKAVASFKGVRRRFEYALKTDKQVLIDDYAHHPEELKALLSGVRSLYGDKKITIVFQPHLFSRTNDLADGFAASLDMADEIILLPIYPARELPIAGVTSELILNKMKSDNKQVLSKEAMLDFIRGTKPELIVMAGAGDIDVLVNKVKSIVE